MVYISLREVINLFKLLQTVIITLYCETKAWEFLIFGIIYWSCPWLNSNLIRKTVINILLWNFLRQIGFYSTETYTFSSFSEPFLSAYLLPFHLITNQNPDPMIHF